MEVVIPVMAFDFNSARSSPRSTAVGGCFFSAPTSPTKMSDFYREFDRFSMMGDTLKSPRRETNNDADEEDEGDDFAFDFSEALEKTSLSADELFDKGKIKPLKPPPRLQLDEYNQKSPLLSSPRSPKSPLSQGGKFIREAFSPRKKKERDPLATAIETSRNQTDRRGRERVQQDSLSKNSSRRATRSLSPYRVSQYPWEEEEKQQQQNEISTLDMGSSSSKPSISSTSSMGSSSSRKWRLRDFFLFRSASEGHGTDKNRFKNKISSSKSITDSSGSVGSSRRKVSAHELHYTTNKAVSENMKRKTFLPYKQGILGRFAFSPLSNGFGTFTRSTNHHPR